MKTKEVDKGKCMTCGKVWADRSLPDLHLEKGKCVYSQCADCFLGNKTTGVSKLRKKSI